MGALEFDFDLEEPILKDSCQYCGTCYRVCPGKDIPLSKLERKFLGDSRTQENEFLGVSKAFFKGFAKRSEIRQVGASGGLTTALLVYGLGEGLIDGALVTGMDPRKPWRVRPLLARTKEELLEAAKSKYTIAPSNIALREAEGISHLAVVGLPCHVHGIRKFQYDGRSSSLAEKIVLVLGIFCGSNWSYKATEHLIGDYSDINLVDIERFDYRGGTDSQDIKIFTCDRNEITITPSERRTIFQSMVKDRCRMCCDWTAELADLSLGDIFDPRNDARKIPNWNSVIVRTEKGMQLIEGAQKAGAIETSPLEEAVFYGNIGFELKKHGAVFHLQERTRYGWPVPNYHYDFTWKPKKRVLYPVPEKD
jgi:coenzyme F420 hydrogenase subunit beta